eukprot:Partr_v1_DN27770_c0_g2_i1_m67272 putative protein kinase kinase kinase
MLFNLHVIASVLAANVAALSYQFGVSPFTYADKSWIFNGKHIVTSRPCKIFYSYTANTVTTLYDGSGSCQSDGMVNAADGNLYIYQLDFSVGRLFVFDLGPPALVGTRCIMKANMTGFTGVHFALDLKHSLIYFPEANSVRVMDITNPISPNLIATMPTTVPNAMAVSVAGNYLFLGRDNTVKRLALNSSTFDEVTAIQTQERIVYIGAYTDIVIIGTGYIDATGTPKYTYWVDPNTLINLRTSLITYKSTMKVSSRYLFSLAGDWQAAILFRVEDISNVSSPVLVYEEPGGYNTGDASTRLNWINNTIWIPHFWSYGGRDISTLVPGLVSKYVAAYPRPYGYLESPLLATGTRTISVSSPDYVVLSDSVLRVEDTVSSLSFASIAITLVSTTTTLSRMQKFVVNGQWADMFAGDTMTPIEISEGLVRVFVADSGDFTLSAYQLGAVLAVKLTVSAVSNEVEVASSSVSSLDAPVAISLVRPGKSSRQISHALVAAAKGTNNLLNSVISNNTILIASAAVILFLLAVCVGISYLYLKKPAPKRRTTSDTSSTFTDMSVTANRTRLSTATSLVGNTTLAAVQTALPLALPGYQQFRYGQDFATVKVIGGGGMSEVFIGRAFHHDLVQFGDSTIIVKVLSDSTSPAMFHQEISIMSALSKYPFFVRLLGYAESPQSILMRNYAMGDLKEYLLTSIARKTKRFQMSILQDVAHGIGAMHHNNLSHSDIKAENILLYSNAQKMVHAVISDFGITKVLDKTVVQVGAFVTVNINGMSLRYAAPELFMNQYRSPQVICTADVYAYGILMYFVETRKRP